MALGDAMERLRQKRLEKIKQRSMEAAERRKARRAEAMAANQERLRAFRDKQQEALGAGEAPEGFPRQNIPLADPLVALQNRLNQTLADRETGGLAARQQKVIENARKRREERRATLAARRRARRGLG